MSPLCKGEKGAQQVVTSPASHRESQLCERKQQAKSLDVVTSSAFPVTIKGHTVAVQVNGATSSLLVDTGSAISPIDNTDNDATLNQINVTIAQTVCIPARSKLEILAKTTVDISEEATWLLEGQQMKESPLVVARALVRPHNNTVVVRLLNPDAKPFTLHEKSNIAVMEPLNSLCVSSTDAITSANINPVVTEEKMYVVGYSL